MTNKHPVKIYSWAGISGTSGFSGYSGRSGYSGINFARYKSTKWWKIRDLSDDEEEFIRTLSRKISNPVRISIISNMLVWNFDKTKLIIKSINSRYSGIVVEFKTLTAGPDYEILYWENFPARITYFP